MPLVPYFSLKVTKKRAEALRNLIKKEFSMEQVIRISKKTLVFIGLFLIAINLICTPIIASETVNSAKIFQANCAGCHANGGNIIRRGKNLKQRALRRNKMNSQAAIITLITNGKNNMPAYEDRLTTEEISAVAAYVLEQAAKGW